MNAPRQASEENDPYATTLRPLGFTNEVGAALSPLIGPVGEMLTYLPALSYIAMDTRDKFYKGDGSKTEDGTPKPSTKRGVEQLLFQLAASVILPTAVVKTSQVVANKVIDLPVMQPLVNQARGLLKSMKPVDGLLHHLRDKPTHGSGSWLTNMAHGFQKVLDTVTIAPLFLKLPEQKSGARNVFLAGVGLTTLALSTKWIDHFTETVILDKLVRPLLGTQRPKETKDD